MIVFAAFTPHTPLLIPSVGKEKHESFALTTAAMNELSEELYSARPETIVIISSHAVRFANAFSINLHEHYRTDFAEFGDLVTADEFDPDLALIDRIQRQCRKADMPITLNSSETLGYDAGVPLHLLMALRMSARIVPISDSGLDAKSHFAFGRELKDVFLNSTRRIAVIGSGDLSHSLASESPQGFRKEGQAYDALIRETVTLHSASKLLAMEPTFREAAAECSYGPLVILFGILERINVNGRELSYEAPFGVGHLVVDFGLRP